jgi:hypothetical protein
MNDGLDEMHSDRHDGFWPDLKEALAAFTLWLIVMMLLSFSLAGCLS